MRTRHHKLRVRAERGVGLLGGQPGLQFTSYSPVTGQDYFMSASSDW